MTRQGDLKRRVRARMAKTGASYSTARSQILTERPPTAGVAADHGWMRTALHVSNGDLH